MVHRFVLASLFVASAAYAQAPGDTELAPPGMAPAQPQPVATNPCAYGSAPVDVMAHRFAIGLSVGHFGIAPDQNPDSITGFSLGELTLRFRATPHFEIEGSMGGGRQQLDNGDQGDLEVRTAMLTARYRFMPYHRWNWWLQGSLGGVSVAQHGSPDQTFKDAQRPMASLGIGLERRWTHFAINAQLRSIAIGPPDQSQPVMGTIGGAPNTTTMPLQPPPDMTSDKLHGGQFILGANYYF